MLLYMQKMKAIAKRCLRENWARILNEHPHDVNKSFDEYPQLNVAYLHFKIIATRVWYVKSFTKMLCEFGFIKYVRYQKIFRLCPFHKNYMKLFVNYNGDNPVKQGLCKYYNYIIAENRNVDSNDFYEIEICERNPNVLHIYLCCIPEYVDYCIAEIAKMRAPLATIFTICCTETAEISPTIMCFADEFIVATVIGFL